MSPGVGKECAHCGDELRCVSLQPHQDRVERATWVQIEALSCKQFHERLWFASEEPLQELIGRQCHDVLWCKGSGWEVTAVVRHDRAGTGANSGGEDVPVPLF